MSEELRATIKSGKFFYRDHYRRMSNILFGSLVIIIFLTLAIIYVFVTRGLPDFYASRSDGELTQIPSLSAPNDSNTPLIQ